MTKIKKLLAVAVMAAFLSAPAAFAADAKKDAAPAAKPAAAAAAHHRHHHKMMKHCKKKHHKQCERMRDNKMHHSDWSGLNN